MKTIDEKNWDAIVIGSGIGGLAAAAVLARLEKKRVLVLERHWVAGGQTHEFTRKGKFSWDVGLHYVGGMGPGEQGRRVMDYITGGAVEWNPLPDPFEYFHFPGGDFQAPRGEKALMRALATRFPGEARGIRAYFKALHRATSWMTSEFSRQLMPAPFAALVGLLIASKRKEATAHTRIVLDRYLKDPLLKAILTGFWPDYGLPPGKSAFALHAEVALHYTDGAWFPEGGASSIAKGVSRVLEQTGGRIELSAEAVEILVENGKAAGVRARLGKGTDARETILRAPLVISDAGADVTYRKLLSAHVPQAWQEALRAFPRGMSAVTLYVGLKDDPRRLGFRGENHWMHETLDHDGAFEWDARDGKPKSAFLSFPSLKNRSAKGHTAEIISHARSIDFETWAGKPWMKRGDDYLAVKERIADGLLDFVERRFPGFRALVEYREVSTPLSYADFLQKKDGEFYGLAGMPERFALPWLKVRTPVPGCLLAGSDVMSLGIMGAMMGGLAAAAVSLKGPGWMRVMGAVKKG